MEILIFEIIISKTLCINGKDFPNAHIRYLNLILIKQTKKSFLMIKTRKRTKTIITMCTSCKKGLRCILELMRQLKALKLFIKNDIDKCIHIYLIVH